MNKHEYSPCRASHECCAMVSGIRCGLPREAACHQNLPPVRDENDRRPRERQDF